MKRRLVIVGAGLAVLVLAGALVLGLTPPESWIDWGHFEAIEVGMTRADLERLLGGPPRNELPGQATIWVPRDGKKVSFHTTPRLTGGPFFAAAEGEEELVWLGEEGLIAVLVGADGRVRDTYFSTVHDRDLTVTEKIRLKWGR
jgi:hypothetical protein